MKSTEQDNFGWRKKAEMNEHFKPISFKLLLSGLYKNCSRSIFYWRDTFENTLSSSLHQYFPKKWCRNFGYPLANVIILETKYSVAISWRKIQKTLNFHISPWSGGWEKPEMNLACFNSLIYMKSILLINPVRWNFNWSSAKPSAFFM